MSMLGDAFWTTPEDFGLRYLVAYSLAGAICIDRSSSYDRGVQERRFKSGEQWEVSRREEGAVIVGKDGAEKQLPLDQTRKFSVFEREKIKLSIGDRIRFTKNVKHRGKKFL